MNPKNQQIAIAEACGFKRIGLIEGSPQLMGELPPCRGWIQVPDYLNDLNAMAQVESEVLDMDQAYAYGVKLAYATIAEFSDRKNSDFIPNGFGLFAIATATAAQRAEAFLRTIGKWKDVP